jgi:hypothetical protein
MSLQPKEESTELSMVYYNYFYHSFQNLHYQYISSTRTIFLDVVLEETVVIFIFYHKKCVFVYLKNSLEMQ